LGGVSVLEMGGVTAEVAAQLKRDYNIVPVRILAGTYMTSLNGLGFSITLLNVVNTHLGGPSMLDLLDAPTEAPGWQAPIRKETWEAKSTETMETTETIWKEHRPSGLKLDPAVLKPALICGLQRVIEAEPDVTRYDTVVGDGDCGVGLKRGAEAILEMVATTEFTGDICVDIGKITQVVEKTMDGTSGALYAIFLNALIHHLRKEAAAGVVSPAVFAKALKGACKSLSKYTPARPGDRTLVDALHPFVDTLESTGDLTEAAEASRKGAEGTKGMQASLGRTVYVGGTGFEEVPDPGAWGLSEFFLGLANPQDARPISNKAVESDYELV